MSLLSVNGFFPRLSFCSRRDAFTRARTHTHTRARTMLTDDLQASDAHRYKSQGLFPFILRIYVYIYIYIYMETKYG